MEEKNTNPLDLYERILNRSQEEVKKVHQYYRLASILITAIIIAGGIFFYTNVWDMKQEARNEVNALRISTGNTIDSLNNVIRNNLTIVEEEVGKQIKTEFDQKNIKDLVKKEAKERIDVIADPIIKEQMNNKILPELNKTEKNISELEFRLTEIAVMNDDRKAFDKITLWAKDKNYLFQNEAEALKNRILLIDYTYNFSATHYIVTQQVHEFNGTIGDLKKTYLSVTKEQKLNLISAVKISKKFSANEKVIFLIGVIDTDDNLSCVYAASSIVINQYKLNFKPLEIDKILNWWDTNKNKI